MSWLSIESAPKDGMAVLVYEGEFGSVAVARFTDGKWWVEAASGYYVVPEYWRPIPEGPNGERWAFKRERPLLVVVPNEPIEQRADESKLSRDNFKDGVSDTAAKAEE
jgi:hypothetical protein